MGTHDGTGSYAVPQSHSLDQTTTPMYIGISVAVPLPMSLAYDLNSSELGRVLLLFSPTTWSRHVNPVIFTPNYIEHIDVA